jgi:hypothetical protein
LKKLNILLLPADDRGFQAGIPYHYAKLGHNVFVPKFGSPDLDWTKIPTWPSLLMKSQSDCRKRNLDIHGFPKGNELLFGEDCFMERELHEMQSTARKTGMPYDSVAACELIDLSKQRVHIDAFHTSANAVLDLEKLFDFTKKYAPHAKWISSTLTHWEHNPGGFNPKNVVRTLPANYDNVFTNRNSCNFYRHHTEFELYDVNRDESSLVYGQRQGGFAGFNHNFHIRQPDGYRLFCETNDILRPHGVQIENYGGNVRKYGADVRYSGDHGVTGKYTTLSPRRAALRYTQLDACVHFKNTDWGGGVPACCRFSATPMITTQHFIDMSHSASTLINGVNCIVVNNASDAAAAVIRLKNDEQLKIKLRRGMLDMHNSLFNDAYWCAWEKMLDNLE